MKCWLYKNSTIYTGTLVHATVRLLSTSCPITSNNKQRRVDVLDFKLYAILAGKSIKMYRGQIY